MVVAFLKERWEFGLCGVKLAYLTGVVSGYGGFGTKLELRANRASCLIDWARLAGCGRIYSMLCLLRGRGLARLMINDVDGSTVRFAS